MQTPLSEYDIECLHKAKMLIDADISEHTTIADLAVKVAMGKTKLKHAFFQYYGVTIYAYLRSKRMELALDLLLHSNKTIKQIAGLTGFLHVSNFIAAFTAYHQTSPGMIRKMKHNK